MIKYIVVTLITICNFGFSLEISSQKVNCSHIFKDSKSPDLELISFQADDQRIRVYGSNLRDWAITCRASPLNKDELVLQTNAHYYSSLEIIS